MFSIPENFESATDKKIDNNIHHADTRYLGIKG